MAGSDRENATASMLAAFAARAGLLDAAAWERIAARCAVLDLPTVSGLFGRAGLFAHSFTPAADPYSRPFLQPAMGVFGTVLGLLLELSVEFAPPEPERFERWAARIRERASAAGPDPKLEPFLAILGLAERQQGRHPGTAAALRAVAIALIARPMAPEDRLAAVYKPFEPEIPYASLAAEPGEHAA